MINVWRKFKMQLKQYGLESFGLYYGEYRGIVQDVNDPDEKGRIKIKCPEVYGSNVPEIWAEPANAIAGNGNGIWWPLEVGDPVWISFRLGNTRFPKWSYGWWRKGKTPDGASNTNRIIRTPAGLIVQFDDSGELITIKKDGDAVEPAVLGNKNAELHTSHIDQTIALVETLTQFSTTQGAAAVGALAPLAPGYTALATGLAQVKVSLEAMKATKPDETKSKSVSLG